MYISPAGFFKKVLDCMTPDILQVVNMSLLSGVFPQAVKTAFIQPLLKKNNLDTSVVNTYRPISNLPVSGKIIKNNYLTINDCFFFFSNHDFNHITTLLSWSSMTFIE